MPTSFKSLTAASFLLMEQTIDLVNYFVTFGDLLMPDPASLYALYYEIVRSGIDPFTDLTKQCKRTTILVSLLSLVLSLVVLSAVDIH